MNKYVASNNVQAVHNNIPPQQQFQASISYATGLVYFPVIIIGLGILSVLIFQSILCFRGCFHYICPNTCQCCYNNESASIPDITQRKALHLRSIYWFFTFLLFAFITNFFVFLGDTSLQTSGKQASNSIVLSANLFTNIDYNANAMSFVIGNISKSFSTQPCQDFWNQIDVYSDFVNYCEMGQSSVHQITDIVGEVPSKLNDANSILTTKGLYYKNISIYVLFSIILVSTILLFVAYFVQLKWLLTVAIELSLLMVLLATLVGATLMFVVVSIRNVSMYYNKYIIIHYYS
jgi:hypothetical protein